MDSGLHRNDEYASTGLPLIFGKPRDEADCTLWYRPRHG